MQPIGLTWKHVTTNPFTGKTSGELMLIHVCLGCGKISTNRIAGDDNAEAIVAVLHKTNELSAAIAAKLNNLSIKLLTLENEPEVLTALYGYTLRQYEG